ncbi:hypothetical protein B0H13DRAFT_1872448 [Mycena leptocephala]|nr:hypothetical protein B0H13DRAFT_1872448 [Mycena leptocephala]
MANIAPQFLWPRVSETVDQNTEIKRNPKQSPFPHKSAIALLPNEDSAIQWVIKLVRVAGPTCFPEADGRKNSATAFWVGERAKLIFLVPVTDPGLKRELSNLQITTITDPITEILENN